MSKLKELFNNVSIYIFIGLTAVFGYVVYLLSLRNKELLSAKARLELANTQKEVDLIEAEIKQKLAEKQNTKVEVEALNKTLDLIKDKRDNLNKEGTLTDKQVEEFWSNKK